MKTLILALLILIPSIAFALDCSNCVVETVQNNEVGIMATCTCGSQELYFIQVPVGTTPLQLAEVAAQQSVQSVNPNCFDIEALNLTVCPY